MDKFTIRQIDYKFDFHTSRSHPGKVALERVVATARLLSAPDIVAEKVFLRPGIDFIAAESYVRPGSVDISKEDRLYLMSRIDWEITLRRLGESKEQVLADATAKAKRIMHGSWSAYLQDQSETA